MLVAVTEASDGWQVAWPAQGKTTTGEDVAHSYHQIQRQNNEKALGELDHWADLHDDATQKWLERWQRRQHDDLAAGVNPQPNASCESRVISMSRV